MMKIEFTTSNSAFDDSVYIECLTPFEVMQYRAVYRVDIKFTSDHYYDATIDVALTKVYYSHSEHEWKQIKGGTK